MRRRLEHRLTAEQDAELTTGLIELTAALESDDGSRVRRAVDALRALGAPAIAAKQRLEAAGLVLTMAGAAGLALGLRARVVETYRVLSGSMLPTLEPGDHVAASKAAYAHSLAKGASTKVPRRGDVVVFRSAAVALSPLLVVPDVLVKRVIGLPGDRIGMRAGTPDINGWLMPTCDAGEYFYLFADGDTHPLQGRVRVEFLEDKTYLTVRWPEAQPFEPYQVQPGEVFVLGDNRHNSLDSRSYNGERGGGVPLGAIEGQVKWFLLGTHRDGSADFGRMLRTVDAAQIHLEGVDTHALELGIARCLRERPTNTYPPAPAKP
jgi:signal peptidase I